VNNLIPVLNKIKRREPVRGNWFSGELTCERAKQVID